MSLKRPRVNSSIALHQILDYMLSFDESGDYSDDPLSDVEDVLDDFALSSSSSDGLLFQFISTTKFTNKKKCNKIETDVKISY